MKGAFVSNKQIFAALEIADHEIRLIVSEFHNLKFNVLKVERIATTGVDRLKIIDENDVILRIKTAISNASKKIGAPITSVILLIPSLDFKRVAKRVTMRVDDHMIKISDIQKALKNAITSFTDDELELVNYGGIRYIVNGFTTRKLPVNEKADSFVVDVDLLCANKQMVWDYVKCVEAANLTIIDIYNDIYAFCSEAALLERAIGHYILMIGLHKDTTVLTLLANGRIESSMILPKGYGRLIEKVVNDTNVVVDVALRLVLNNTRMQSKVSDDPVYLYTYDDKTYTLSEKDIRDMIEPLINDWIEDISLTSKDILETEMLMGVIYGEGANISEIDELLSERLKQRFNVYIPETLGIRDSSLASCAGSFYCYRDQEVFRNNSLYSIDSDEFIKAVTINRNEEKEIKDDTLTNRFKRLFK
ncbi:MAG: hypothetical protein PHG99_05900 [Erysipelotrichaceae bacterium]|nr:hypothetical protein [Erysipelotrichaceae bacterium]